MEFKEGTKKEKGVLECLLYFLRYPIKSIRKAMDYDYLSNQHTNTINEISKLYGEIKALKEKREVQEKTVVNLTSERDSLKSKVNELTEDIGKYKKSVLESLEYKTLEEEKEKVGKELCEYKKQLEDRNTLIDLLKADKVELIRTRNLLLREKSIGTLIKFFKEDKNYSKQPYVFIDPDTEKIIDYTDGFKKELEANGNLIGQSYLTILDGKENVDRIRYIKKFLKVNEEKEFDVEYEKGGKKIPLHIVKKPPIFVELDIKSIGISKNNIETIACVPLLVEKVGKWSMKFHKHSLDEVMEKTEEELKLAEEAEKETPKVHMGLIKYGWKADGILKIENKMGPIQSYLYFKKIFYELEAKEKKQMEQEEINRKAERKIETRKRLKRMKAERKKREEKRDKIIKSFGKTYKVKKEDMIKIWDESKNFSDFIYRCRETSRPYRTKQEPQETKPI